MYIIGRFKKLGYIKYVGHLDLVALLEKSFKRAGLKVAYTRGFNPQPNISIANPLPLGIESQCEYIQIELEEDQDLEGILPRINQELPKGVAFDKLVKTDKLKLEKLSKLALFSIQLPQEVDILEVENRMKNIYSSESFILMRPKKRKKYTVEIPFDLRSFLVDFSIDKEAAKLYYTSKSSNGASLRADLLIEAINKEGFLVDPEDIGVLRISQVDSEGQDLI